MIDSKGNELGKLFIGGLSQSTNNDSLRLYFSRFGKIDKAIVMMDNKTGRSRGFGYIKYYEYKSVILTLEVKLHIIDGKQVDVKQFNINMKGCNRRNLKIFVGGISLEQDIESIKAYFKQYGHVTDVNLMMDINKQKHRGFAFVEFDNENVVKQLINLHYVNMNNKQVEIKAMEPKNFSRKVKNNHTLRQISTTITSNNNNNSGNICNLSSKNPSYTDISHFHEVYQHTNNPLNFTVNHLPSSAYSLHNHPFLPFQLNNQLEFLQPNTIRYLPVFYNHQQMNISDPAFPTLIHSNTDNYINTNNYLDDSFSVQNNLISEYTLQPIAFMNKPFTGNQSILQNSTNKSTTGKHSSTSVLSPLYITTLANVNPYHKINRVQVPPKHPSYIPPILTTNQLKQQSHSLFYSNIFNFQQLNPSVYTIQCELIPLHVISPSSNSMIKQSSCNNITPIVVCNDMPNNTDSGIFSTTSKNSSTKKEEQHITNDNLSKAISTASNTANALTTSGIVSISMDNTSTAVTLSSEATDSATTNTTNADATNLTKLKGITRDHKDWMNSSIQDSNFTRVQVTPCTPVNGNYSHFNHHGSLPSMNYLPNSSLTSYCAFCPQNQTGSSTMLTGNASVQIPTNYHYNCLMNTNLYTTDNAAINSNLNIRVTDQDTSFLTSSSRNRNVINNEMLAEQNLNTSKFSYHPTLFLAGKNHESTHGINYVALCNTCGNMLSNSLLYTSFQPTGGYNLPTENFTLSNPQHYSYNHTVHHHCYYYYPNIPQNQSLNRHTDMVSLWNSTSAFNETNTDSNISKSINNDVVNVSDGIVNSNNTVNSVNSIPSSLSSVSSLLSSSTISTLPSPSSSTSSLKKTQSTKLMTNTLNSTVITTKNFSTFSSPSLPSLTTSNITTVDNATSVKSRNIKKEICLINTSLENRHHISDVVPAKPSGDNFEGILVNNNNISQCNNSNNIHCFYKSSLSDLAPVFIESQNGEVVRPFQYNNDTIVHFTTTNTDDINYDNSL